MSAERDWVFDFGVKFYAPEPNVLQEEITRFLLCLLPALKSKQYHVFNTHCLLIFANAITARAKWQSRVLFLVFSIRVFVSLQ